MSRTFKLWLLALLAVSACKSTNQSTLQTEPAAAAQGSVFVGCRPSPGECKSSCPQQDGVAELDPNKCEDQLEPYACYCGGLGAPQQPEPPESTHVFIGCRWSGGECKSSCPGKEVVALSNSPRCEGGEGQIACFCAR